MYVHYIQNLRQVALSFLWVEHIVSRPRLHCYKTVMFTVQRDVLVYV